MSAAHPANESTPSEFDAVSALLPPYMREAPPTPETYVVVLYYSYCVLAATTVAELRSQIERDCKLWQLAGRIRVSIEGLNGTLGGSWKDVCRHVHFLQTTPLLPVGAGAAINFKFGLADPLRPIEEQKLRGHSVKITKEVVSLHPNDFDEQNSSAATHRPADVRLPAEAGTAEHVSPQQWDAMLSTAAHCAGETVILDTRNTYEIAVGHFDVPGVECVNPKTRSFADFPQWVASNKAAFRDKTVMMCCTGGVRCERASQLLTGPDVGAKRVVQLENGIHAYFEQHAADGGHFAGRLFVFDDRMAVAPPLLDAPRRVCGHCLVCSAPCDDYTPGCRCAHCRIRVLVCDACRAPGSREAATLQLLLCEGCTSQKKSGAAATLAFDDTAFERKRVRLENQSSTSQLQPK